MQTVMSSKQAAGNAAASLVEDGMILGLGTGSTVTYFLDAVALRMNAEGLNLKGVPTSEDTAEKARGLGIVLSTLEETPELDLVVDGADEVDAAFRLIKGGGGALLREKIVASAGAKVAIIVGEGKRVERLGTTFLLPVEILPFGHTTTAQKVAAQGCQPFLRTTDEEGTLMVTDNGNYILDCKFEEGIQNPEELHRALSEIPGVAEVGLFLNHCDILVEGLIDGTARIRERNES
ncbi:MAG TPA: ribose 5-phosphate isomerase A [Planctomycetota bacterium]|jgi:ribose 5-phosphate isomerase A|nr:ribose 5-phosphate isomerase A [Planctomycetota bacterium]MDP7245033.1 ribose 5-phosphate isomerase A [Planctomycetota bacterium]HJM39774.1 ribose 5-phosphate isomerase A [Planctomycetota bacterium]|tara:strand:- start:1797 stop:2501 length:705 start_codon:yes stop_codon:yes gene_type:complete